MFCGTIRDNLDPSGLADDVTIWAALHAARLSTHVSGLEGKLEAEARVVCCACDLHGQNADACVLPLEVRSRCSIVETDFPCALRTVAQMLREIIGACPSNILIVGKRFVVCCLFGDKNGADR